MAADGKIIGTDVIDQSAHDAVILFTKETDDLLKKYVELAGGITSFRAALSNVKGYKDVTDAIKGQREKMTELEKIKKQLVIANEKLIASQTLEAQLLARIKQEQVTTNAETRNFIKSTQMQEGSIDQLNAKLIQLKKEYTALSAAEREAAKGKDLLVHIQDVRANVGKMEADMGMYHKNVGNYASGWNALGNSINQLTREAPAFANSMQTGFMAISNNIPALFDAIKGIRTQNTSLAAEGKPTVSVLKQLAGAVFSWQTLLSVGVTLLTVYGSKIVDFAMGTTQAEKEAKKLKSTLDDSQKSFISAAESVGSEIVKMKQLYSIATDVNLAMKTRKYATNELQRLYPSYLGNLKDEVIMAGKATDAYNNLSQALLNKAMYEGISAQAVEVGKGLAPLIVERDRIQGIVDKLKGPKGLKSKEGYFISGQQSQADVAYLSEMEQKLKSVNQTIGISENQMNALIESAKKYVDLSDTLDSLDNTKTKKPKKEKEQNRIDDLKKQYENELKIAETSYNKGESNYLQYQLAILNIIKTSGIERLGIIKNLTAKEKQSAIDFGYDLGKMYKKAMDDIRNYAKKTGDEWSKDLVLQNKDDIQNNLTKQAKESLDNFQKWLDTLPPAEVKVNLKFDINNPEDRKKLNKALEAISAYTNSTLSALSVINDAIEKQNELKFDNQEKRMNSYYDSEEKRINQSGLSAAKKEEELMKLSAQREAQQKQIDRDRTTAQRKAATRQKVIDIAQAIANTALSVGHALSDKSVPYYLAVANAVSAGIIGTAQVASIVATPLPQYKDGTENHPGGLAVVGDGNEHELILEPNKKPYFSPKKATIMNLPARTQVLPPELLLKKINEVAMVKLAKSGQVVNENTMSIALQESFNELSHDVKNLIKIMDSKNMNVEVTGNFDHYMHVKKNIR